MNELKTILITGGAGFIGSHFATKLLQMGFIVHLLDNLSTGTINNLPKHPNLIFHYGSILDKEKIKQFNNMNLVLHLAGGVGMKFVKEFPGLTYDIATEGTANVLNHTGNAPVVLFSSSSVYGLISTKNKMKEDIIINRDQLLEYDGGVLGYACGKLDMEQLGLKFAEQGRKIMIIRPFNVIGSKQVGKYGMVVPTFIELALKNAPITIYGDGTQSRCFSFVDTLIASIIKLIECDQLWKINHNIVNVGTDVSTTINQLADEVINISKSTSKIVHLPFNEIFHGQKDVQHRVPDTTYYQRFCEKIDWPSIKVILGMLIKEKTHIVV